SEYYEGTATITAQAGDKMATCTVTVKPPMVQNIMLDETEVWLAPGDRKILIATVTPNNAASPTWSSSNPEVAMVDDYGMITAVAEGTAIITAQVDGFKATCVVFVNKESHEQPDLPGAVESITLNTYKLTIEPGGTRTLIATVYPYDADDKTVVWSAFNPLIATVDDDGKVTAISEGSTFITARVGDKTAECEVDVKTILVPVESVTLDVEKITLKRGETYKLTATVLPEDADDKTVAWSSTVPEIATVDENGMVVAIKACDWDYATIIAQAGYMKAECFVYVNPGPVESITLTKTKLSLACNKSDYLYARVTPDDAEDKTVEWSSSDANIVTVEKTGDFAAKITTRNAGTATITAQVGGKTATCEVIVHKCAYKDGKCTVCGKNPYMSSGTIDENGVLKKYYSMGDEKPVVIPDGVTGIGDGAFSDCTSLTGVTIPDSVTSIGNSAFRACYGLTGVTIPNRVTSIGEMAFFECWSIKSMTIPNSVTSIGSRAFEKCKSLNSVEIPASVKSIGSDAFKDCTNLTKIQFSGTKAQWNAIKGNDKVDITCILCSDGYIGINVEKIPEYLTISGRTVTGVDKNKIPATLVIPDGVTKIGQYAFSSCKGLTGVTIPDSVTSIGYNAFGSCTGLTKVTIPDRVTSIEGGAFSGCKGLTSMTIPNSVTSIGDNAFSFCSGLTSVTIPNSVTSIGDGTFAYCSKLGSVTIPGSVTSIGGKVFSNCTSLTSVTIPNSVTSIGGEAFSGCSGLTSVTIPDSVTSIGNSAFSGCSGLTSVTIPDSVTSIGDSAFYGCSGLTSMTIPEGVTSIGQYAFYSCTGLTNLWIPSSVTSIGQAAFKLCNNLTTVRYIGTKAEWDNIKKNGAIFDSNSNLLIDGIRGTWAPQ
ncbi:MAG: leucine-rich repeat protein, partial [Treponemataceae bacterium]|nr:leucine-rich repeat protein [Treponemataceae bacterium]